MMEISIYFFHYLLQNLRNLPVSSWNKLISSNFAQIQNFTVRIFFQQLIAFIVNCIQISKFSRCKQSNHIVENCLLPFHSIRLLFDEGYFRTDCLQNIVLTPLDFELLDRTFAGILFEDVLHVCVRLKYVVFDLLPYSTLKSYDRGFICSLPKLYINQPTHYLTINNHFIEWNSFLGKFQTWHSFFLQFLQMIRKYYLGFNALKLNLN